jgi:hypothetical protein
VNNNRCGSPFFKLTRGIRQGCPVSALLFILIVEILANALRKNPRITGIKLGGIEWKIGQYADDTCLFVQDERSLALALTVIDMFSKCSGLKMNRDKSEAMYIGVSSNFRHTLNNIKYTNASVKCLVIYINKNKTKVTNNNISAKLEKIEHLIGVVEILA